MPFEKFVYFIIILTKSKKIGTKYSYQIAYNQEMIKSVDMKDIFKIFLYSIINKEYELANAY